MESDNKRIAKNTILLYVRSILVMAIGLYTSRVVLQVLGVDNFGLYGAIGSIVAMFTIINGTLAAGTSRFLTFELGRADNVKLKKTFNASLAMHTGMAICLFVLMETIGLWFVNYKMNIPEGRELAANIVYQLSILTCMVGLTQVPYGAIIIAHEKMNIYAYVAIAEVVFKLALVAMLLFFPFSDSLIAYAIIIAAWSIGLQLFYRIYCYKRFPETHLSFCREKAVYKNMLSYSLWDTIGQFCATGNSNGLNILINMFYGVGVNAAVTIGHQVEGAVTQLTSSFTTAVSPQIIKSYAIKNTKRFFELIYEAGRYSYFLLFIFAFPILLEIDYLLKIWLTTVPPDTAIFVRFIVGITLFRVIARPTITGVHATGNVKYLNLTSGVYGMAVFLPTVYILFKLGYPVWICFVVKAFNAVVCTILEARSLYREIYFSPWYFIRYVYVQTILISILAGSLPVILMFIMPDGFVRLMTVVIVNTITTCACGYYLVLTPQARLKVSGCIKTKILSKCYSEL